MNLDKRRGITRRKFGENAVAAAVGWMLDFPASPNTYAQEQRMSKVIRDDFYKPISGPLWDFRRTEYDMLTLENGIFYGRRAVGVTVGPYYKREAPKNGPETVRSEVGEHEDARVPEGAEAEYRMSFLVPEHYRDSDIRTVIMQWKAQDSGQSPPFEWRYRNGELFFTVQTPNGRIESKHTPLEKGVWYTMALRYELRPDRTGYCFANLNGRPMFEHKGKIGDINDSTSLLFKFGLYRDHEENGDLSATWTAYFSDFFRSYVPAR